MTERNIVFYEGAQWKIAKKGFIICECGKRYYNSVTCKANHLKTKGHINYISTNTKDKEEIKFNEKNIYWKEKQKKWVLQKKGQNYTFENLEEAVQKRNEIERTYYCY